MLHSDYSVRFLFCQERKSRQATWLVIASCRQPRRGTQICRRANFKFNLIVIDNHSTDGTTEAIDEFKDDERVIHLIPERQDLGIGGCWNLGVHHEKCGKFAVQLDSDDVYKDENTDKRLKKKGCFNN